MESERRLAEKQPAKKQLADMSLEELWQLFPISLEKHNPCWKDWYAEEETNLRRTIPSAVRINHIGSTAIGGIWSKPIIDILVEVPQKCDLEAIADKLTHLGYIRMNQTVDRISFNKGYTKDGFAEKVFHLHLRLVGDNDELYFRDYLNEHHRVACKYEALKLSLWKTYEHDRDAYTEAKSEFVRKHTDAAKLEYADRY